METPRMGKEPGTFWFWFSVAVREKKHLIPTTWWRQTITCAFSRAAFITSFSSCPIRALCSSPSVTLCQYSRKPFSLPSKGSDEKLCVHTNGGEEGGEEGGFHSFFCCQRKIARLEKNPHKDLEN